MSGVSDSRYERPLVFSSAPGSVANPTGTLSGAGDVTSRGLRPPSRWSWTTLGAGQYNQLSATGTVDLGLAAARSVNIGYNSSSGDTFAGVITCANLVNADQFMIPSGIQDSYSATDLDRSIG